MPFFSISLEGMPVKPEPFGPELRVEGLAEGLLPLLQQEHQGAFFHFLVYLNAH